MSNLPEIRVLSVHVGAKCVIARALVCFSSYQIGIKGHNGAEVLKTGLL